VRQKGKKVIASPMRFRDNKTCAEVVHQVESLNHQKEIPLNFVCTKKVINYWMKRSLVGVLSKGLDYGSVLHDPKQSGD
jgi:hypothetical protein